MKVGIHEPLIQSIFHELDLLRTFHQIQEFLLHILELLLLIFIMKSFVRIQQWNEEKILLFTEHSNHINEIIV